MLSVGVAPQGQEIRNAYQSSIPGGGGTPPSGLLPHMGFPMDLSWFLFVFVFATQLARQVYQERTQMVVQQ